MQQGTHTGRVSSPRLRGARRGLCSRLLHVAPALLIVAALAALVPVSVDVCRLSVNVHTSQAEAAKLPVSGIPVSWGRELVEIYSDAAGIDSSQFTATVMGIEMAGTGLNLTKGPVEYSAEIETNLGNLIDSADYPDWITLTEEEQSQWGSQSNYDAAKFHEFLGGLGFNDTKSRYQAFKESGGGGDFTLDSTETEKLQQIGTIGRDWMAKGGVILDDILGAITNRDLIYTALVGTYSYKANGAGIEGWPVSVPVQIAMAYGTQFKFKSPNVSTKYYIISPKPVYGFVLWNGDRNDYRVLWSDSPFLYGEFWNTSGTPTAAATKMGNVYGNIAYGTHVSGQITGDLPVNTIVPLPAESDLIEALNLLVDNGKQPSPDVEPTLEGYVPDAEPETEIYIPDGVSPDSTWPGFQVQPVVERPDNPSNPEDPEHPEYQSGTPEWKEDTTKNLLPLFAVRLDKLFPFCMVYDLQELYSRFSGLLIDDDGELSTQAVESYTTLRFPLRFQSEAMGLNFDEVLEIDLVPLKDLLNLIKPYMFWFLLFWLVMSIIHFWKRILTGA